MTAAKKYFLTYLAQVEHVFRLVLVLLFSL